MYYIPEPENGGGSLATKIIVSLAVIGGVVVGGYIAWKSFLEPWVGKLGKLDTGEEAGEEDKITCAGIDTTRACTAQTIPCCTAGLYSKTESQATSCPSDQVLINGVCNIYAPSAIGKAAAEYCGSKYGAGIDYLNCYSQYGPTGDEGYVRADSGWKPSVPSPVANIPAVISPSTVSTTALSLKCNLKAVWWMDGYGTGKYLGSSPAGLSISANIAQDGKSHNITCSAIDYNNLNQTKSIIANIASISIDIALTPGGAGGSSGGTSDGISPCASKTGISYWECMSIYAPTGV